MSGISRIAALWVLVVCTFTPRLHAQGPRTIFLVRHADKVSEATDALLSEEGHRRANCLANTLRDANIGRIYTSDLHRTQQTAAPLAERLHLNPVSIPLSKPNELIAALRSDETPIVLVVWHGGTLPDVLRALGAPQVAPIENAEYDRFFMLTFDGNKKHANARLTVLRYCDCAKN
jgi:broad specificity phosphatase PhoE